MLVHDFSMVFFYQTGQLLGRLLFSAECSLSCQLFGQIFTLLENLQFPYCCTRCKQTFVRFVCSLLGPFIKNILFNFL
jgi:hypothetical protein